MRPSKKEAPRVYKWAIITEHHWLPSRADQVAQARAWGIEKASIGTMDVSHMIEDDVRKVKRTTNWIAKLANRMRFLDQLRAYLKDPKAEPVEAMVFFANPLCVGFSAKLAKDTMQLVWDAGAEVYVHSVRNNGAAIYRDGDDITDFLDSVAKMANAKHQSKARKSK